MGVPELDQQHRELFDGILVLHEAMKSRESSLVVDSLIGKFRSMLSKHFKYEEKFLADHGMPASEEHKKDHARMIEKFEKIAKGTKVGMSIRLMDFFYTSLFTHIEKLDSVYVRGSECQQKFCMQL
jgi:hemerythrin